MSSKFLVSIIALTGILLLPDKAFAQNNKNVLFFGSRNVACERIISANGNLSINCTIDGLTVVDLKNNIEISCYGINRPFGTWQRVPNTPWYKVISHQPPGGCYKTHYSSPVDIKGAQFLQTPTIGLTGAASLLWNYDVTSQSLNYCIAPFIIGSATQVLCDHVNVEVWPR